MIADVDLDPDDVARAERSRRQARRLLVIAALGQLVLLGWRVHGEGRYVFFATSALTVLGAAWLAIRPRRALVTAWAIAIAAIPSALITGRQLEHLADQRAGFVAAAVAIRADAATIAARATGQRCLILTGNVPQAIWYARCAAIPAWGPPEDERLAWYRNVYLLTAAGQVRQPDAATLIRPGVAWKPLACSDDPVWCVYGAIRTAAP